MGEAQEVHLKILVQEAREADSSKPSLRKEYKWWLRMAIYTVFLLAGQSVGTLLGRLYFDKGGKSKWLATLVQFTGFPILVPFLYMSLPKSFTANKILVQAKTPSFSILASVYIPLGLLLAANSLLYTIGLLYLPVSTYALICASQLAFNAFFSFLLNSQKFTAPIVNSLVIITISSTLLVFEPDSDNQAGVFKEKYVIGFLSTVGASAVHSIMLSLTQLAFDKVLKSETFPAVLNMIIYQSLVATIASVVGLFASGEWNDLYSDMEEFKMGRLSYFTTLLWTVLSWEFFSIGAVGLIFEVSSLFSNVISTLGLPVVPVFAVIFFHDEMNGIKIIAMVWAIWGFVSYVYQHYIDDCKSKTRKMAVDEASCAFSPERD